VREAVARCYGDEDVPVLVARVARGLQIDIVHTEELGRKGTTDEEQLLFAATEGRILLTRNCKDFRPFSNTFAERGLPHAGVLCLSPALAYASAARIARLLLQWDTEHLDGMPAYMLDYLR
jgi:predicted nuclease of predicted toxin-antitoxin system